MVFEYDDNKDHKEYIYKLKNKNKKDKCILLSYF